MGDIVSDDRTINNDIIGFTETHIIHQIFLAKTIETLSLFNINFNSNETKFLGLVYGCRNVVAVLNKFDANGR